MAEHVCPWWLGYLLASPIRRLFQDPEKIIAPYIKDGMTALDIGPGMGYFTIPMARLVGEHGRVIAVDLQEKMLKSLQNRAHKAGLADRIETRVCPSNSLGIDDLVGKIDFALTFAVLHETPDIGHILSQVYASLKIGGHLLIAEPTGHVSEKSFEETTGIAQKCGFEISGTPVITRSRTLLVRRP
jgi:ubiquinone/menaquinone biosynthesis C-methylase UbiE